MRTATVAEVQDHLSDLLEEVGAGGSVLIIDEGRPLARVTSLADPQLAGVDPEEARLSRLEDQGLLDRGAGGLATEILAPPPQAPPGLSILRVLLDERDEGR